MKSHVQGNMMHQQVAEPGFEPRHSGSRAHSINYLPVVSPPSPATNHTVIFAEFWRLEVQNQYLCFELSIRVFSAIHSRFDGEEEGHSSMILRLKSLILY